MVTILSEDFSLVQEWVNELRDVNIQKDRMRFRKNLERIGEIAAFEISKHLPTQQITIKTPLDQVKSHKIAVQPVVTTILRAGVPLFNGVLNYLDKADAGFVAAYRKHEANDYFSIKQDYITCPELTGRPLVVADSMLATGASLLEAIKDLLTHGEPSQLHIVAAIASKKGVDVVRKAFPKAYIWVAAVDPHLTSQGYISPGLGDSGDLSFGQKLQG